MTFKTYEKIYKGENIDCMVAGTVEKFSKWEKFKVLYKTKGCEDWQGGNYIYSSKASAQKAARNMVKNS